MRALARKYEDFFRAQFVRLDEFVKEQQKLAAQTAAADRLLKSTNMERREWEAERDRELLRISEASEKLAKAWEHLENEQQRFLIQGNTTQSPPAQVSEHSDPAESAIATVPASLGIPAQTTQQNQPAPVRTAPQTNAFENEQLRRQMNQHAKRRR